MDKEYIVSEYRRLHQEKKFNGDTLALYISDIKELIETNNCNTILDYGCGKARCHKKNKLGNVTLYDPYYDPYSSLPNDTYDMVICTDVLEHIPEDEIGRTLAALINYTNKVLFLTICTKPAKKTFRNGQNVHLTIKPKEWWEEMLSTVKDIKIVSIYT